MQKKSIVRNSLNGRYVVKTSAAKAVSRIEGIVMKREMSGFFLNAAKSGIRGDALVGAALLKYGKRK